MNPRLLEYYNRELIYMRAFAGEFARQHPKVAARLGMQAGEIADPYVERLIEAFCFMTARTELKLDAEFPRFTERLLEVIYPNYIAPTPSMAVARIFPSQKDTSLTAGKLLGRGTRFQSRIPDGERTACQFVSGQDVTIYPLRISSAKLTGAPADIPSLGRYLPADKQARGALRLRLSMTNGDKIQDLRGLDELPIYLGGDEAVASQLFELIHTTGFASVISKPGQFGVGDPALSVVTKKAVVHEGLEQHQNLLPLVQPKFHGHNLLHEYFVCPSRFYFFKLAGLQGALSRINAREVEIVILLDRDAGHLAPLVDESRFALFCTPIINLFRHKADPIEPSQTQTEFRICVSRKEPLDYEVFAIEHLYGQESTTSEKLEFRSLYQSLNRDDGNHGRYFSLRRERRLMSDTARRYGARSPYIGTETYVSLVDQGDAPYPKHMRYLHADAWVTNRDLPLLVPRDGMDDLVAERGDGVESIGLIRPPSVPKPPFAEREAAWRLIRQLNFNYLPFSDMDHREGAQGLRELLQLFLTREDTQGQRQVQGLTGVKTKPVNDLLPPGNEPLVFGRGISCVLTVDESQFSGVSPYVFGLILEHYLARHVSLNSFTRTELNSSQRGLIWRWPTRMGTRGVA